MFIGIDCGGWYRTTGAKGACIRFCGCGLIVAITVAGMDTPDAGREDMTLGGWRVTVPVGLCGVIRGGKASCLDVSLLIIRHSSI